MKTETSLPTERVVSIDRTRGLAVILMILCQIAERFGCFGFFGAIGEHGEDGVQLFPGYALADLAEPLFLLLVALSFWLSYRKRVTRDGVKVATLHFATRFCAIIGIGYAMRIVELATAIGNPDFELMFMPVGFASLGCLVLCILAFLVGKLFKIKRLAVCGKITVGLLAVMGIIDIALDTFTAVAYSIPAYDLYNLDWWGPLQSIGAAGLMLLLLAQSGTLVRGIAAAVMLFYYTVLHQMNGMQEYLDCDIQAGLFGAVSWGAMLIGFSVMADLFFADKAARDAGARGRRSHTYEVGMGVLIVLGVAGAILLPVNKGSASPGYILSSMSLSCVVFYLVSLTEKMKMPKYPVLSWWGKSPLFMYLMQYLLNDIAFVGFDSLDHVPFFVALAYLFFVFALLTWISYELQNRKKTIRL